MAGRRQRSQRIAAAVIVGALAAGGLLASLGAGYVVAHNALSDASAYAAKGTAVVHVNGETRRIDAKTAAALGGPTDQLDVIELGSGQLGVLNESTGVVTTVDPATMQPQAKVRTGRAKAPADTVLMVASGDQGWLVDRTSGQVTLLRDGKPVRSVRLPGAIADAAGGPQGSVLVLTADGNVVRVGTDGIRTVQRVKARTGAALTRSRGHAYVVGGDGAVVRVDGSAPAPVTRIAGVSRTSGQVVVGSVRGAGAHILVVTGDALAVVDPANGDTSRVELHSGSTHLGQPVELGDRAYVPDYAKHRLLVVNTHTGATETPLAVPGSDPTFAVFVSEGRLWANDQYSRTLLEIARDGTHQVIDKGTGDGVRDKPKRGPRNQAAGPKPAPHPTRPPTTGPVVLPAPNGPTRVAPRLPSVAPVPPATNPAPAPRTANKPAPVPRVTLPSFPAGTNYQDACERIEALGPTCTAVAAGADNTGDTGDVIDTKPAGGSSVPKDSQVVVRYVGKLAVPDLPNPATPRDTCAVIEAASLRCNPVAARAPVTSPQQFGIVTDESPAAGTEVAKGSTVTISYPDTFTMPNVANRSGTDACTVLRQYVLQLPGNVTRSPKCTTQQGTAARPNSNANKVYQQQPAPGTAQSADAAVTLTVYSGTAALSNLVGKASQQALNECNQSFQCTAIAGDPPIGHPQDANTVQSQDKTPGTYPTDTTVHLQVWRGDNTVPDVTGMSTAGGANSPACQALAHAGFVCDVNSSHPFTKTFQVANAGAPQSPAGGATAALGTTVVVPNSVWQPIPLMRYQANSGDTVYVVRLQGQPVPDGYGNGVALGYAYAVGSGIPVGAWTPNMLYCVSGPANCDEHSPNHMYTRAPLDLVHQLDGNAWQMGGPVADLIAPQGGGCGAGQVPLYRGWIFSDGTKKHDYYITTNPGDRGYRDTELLGCLWS